MAKLDDFSRFQATPELVFDGQQTFGPWVRPSWLTDPLDPSKIQVYFVTNAFEGRPDNISNVIYGTPLLSWVLLAFNHVQNPFGWPKAGTVIKYPVSSVVFPNLI